MSSLTETDKNVPAWAPSPSNHMQNPLKGPREMPLEVLLADDHAAFREELKVLLKREGFQVAGEAANGQEALKLAGKLLPDLAILDVAMPVLNGLEAARKMAQVSPGTKIILLSVHSEAHYVVEAFRAGASGYLLKRRVPEELLQAIRIVSEGRCFLCSGAACSVLQAFLAKPKPAKTG